MLSAPLVVTCSGKMKLYEIPFVGRFFNSATSPSAYLSAAIGSRGPALETPPSKQKEP